MKAKQLAEHRDATWKSTNRVLKTLRVFAYQGTVFYAQMVLSDELFVCNGDDRNDCTL